MTAAASNNTVSRSASERKCAPLAGSFSRGRSFTGQCLVLMLKIVRQSTVTGCGDMVQ
jgi:hypothetical protein